MNHAIVILSGGMDSAVVMASLLARGVKVTALTVDYAQRHSIEIDHARQLCAYYRAKGYGVEHVIADLCGAATCFTGSSQTSANVAVPHGHYAEESMKLTVVPNRNMVLLALAGALAVSRKADAIAFGAHAGDHAIYPDCRPEFANLMGEALKRCDWSPVELVRPFIDMTKADIARLGHELGVPFRLTYSCYEGLAQHCGKCGTCTERKEAFQLAGVTDTTFYRE